ncbi:MAG: TIGR01777 family oxidoreductase [Candidatus Aminicenantes bacterium]|nr:TIGR01777 family oxidoreductase [Candidatus Aminicenantes bacterium]
MKVFIAGGTGFIGSSLTKRLIGKGLHVTVLTRKIRDEELFPKGVGIVEGDSSKPGSWQEELGDSDAVINLAGASIFQRWTKKRKRSIRESRIATTKNIAAAVALRKDKRIDLINASAVGYYGYHGDEILDETAASGTDFLATLARDWEAEALRVRESGARIVLCRFGIVLGSRGGALAKMLPLFRMGIGARLGSGEQWFSWIHEEDLFRILLFLLENREIQGAVNCLSPHPVQNKNLTKTLAGVLHRPLFMPPVPGFLLRIALGGFAESLIKGQRAVPKVLMDSGFTFLFPDIESALSTIELRS